MYIIYGHSLIYLHNIENVQNVTMKSKPEEYRVNRSNIKKSAVKVIEKWTKFAEYVLRISKVFKAESHTILCTLYEAFFNLQLS